MPTEAGQRVEVRLESEQLVVRRLPVHRHRDDALRVWSPFDLVLLHLMRLRLWAQRGAF